MSEETYDVVVIGGGAAGLSGATALARSRRSVLVVDAGKPRNAPAEGVHGLLSRDGVSPLELLAIGRSEVEKYGGKVVGGEVTSVTESKGQFQITLDDGSSVAARRLLLTTGLVDELPPVEGVRELWGTDVVHCPYCHGWEVRDQPIAILGFSAQSVHQALLFRQLSDDLVYFAISEVAAETLAQFAARGIRVVSGAVSALESDGGRLTGVRLASGEVIARTVAVVAPRFSVNSEVLSGIGLKTAPHASGFGEVVEVDMMGQTSVPGVFAAGNVTDPMAQVVLAAGAGMRTGAGINADLVNEESQV